MTAGQSSAAPESLRETSVIGGPDDASIFRVYRPEECDPKTGYPFVWTLLDRAYEGAPKFGLKDLVRERAGHRCIRCGHPYRTGEHGDGEWSPCDEQCRHGGPVRWSNGSSWEIYDGPDETIAQYVEARWRILTVHHANGIKSDLRWWNLLPLCQRDHLHVQGRVVLERAFIFEHSEWFRIYAAGWYAFKYLGEEITRAEAEARADELLGLERLA